MKILLGFVAQEARYFAISSPDSREAQLMEVCTWGFETCVAILDPAKDILEECEWRLAAFAGRLGLVAYQELAQTAIDKGQNLWTLRPKLFAFNEQLFLLECRLNPTMWSCWMDEDLMGRLRDMCQNVVGPAKHVAYTALVRCAEHMGSLACADRATDARMNCSTHV